MGPTGTRLALALTLLLLRAPATEALKEQELCYVLDAILFLYGVVLTVLYCRLKVLARRVSQQRAGAEQKEEEAIYTGLSGEAHETYDTLQMKQA